VLARYCRQVVGSCDCGKFYCVRERVQMLFWEDYSHGTVLFLPHRLNQLDAVSEPGLRCAGRGGMKPVGLLV
jgi:hypothetical protein